MSGRYDPVLLTKIARIYAERDAVSMLALEGEVDRDSRLVGEERQILALANEFGRDAVLAALMDVQQVRIETCKRVFGLRHVIEDSPSGQAAVLLKKIAQIFREATDVVFVVGPPVDENHPQIVSLVNEFGRDVVLEMLAEVTKIWKEAVEEAPDNATEAQRVPGVRLN